MSTSLNGHSDLAKHLERWVDEDLISRSEAEAIARFEQRGEVRPHRISLVTEAIGYVGAALLLAAGATLTSRFWDDMDELARITVLAIATLVLLALGWVFSSSPEPAVGRLGGVLWVGAVGSAAGLAAVIAVDVGNAEDRIPQLVAGLAATAAAVPLYVLRRKALQHIALFLGATLAVGSAFLVEESPTAGYAVWVFAAIWIVVTWFGLLPPERAGFALGSLAVLISAQTVAVVSEAGLWLGLAASAALLAASVVRHERILLGFGVVGLFGFTMGTIQTYLGGGAGTVAGLAVAGFVVIVIALLLSRRTARREMQG